MISGVVKADEARIRLKVKGPRGKAQEIEAVIDTGYTGSLTLPPDMIASLALEWRSVDRGTLLTSLVSALLAVSCLAVPFLRGPLGWRVAAIILGSPSLFVVCDFLRRAPHAFGGG